VIKEYLAAVKARYREVRDAERRLAQIEELQEANDEIFYATGHRMRYVEAQKLNREWLEVFDIYRKGYILYPLFGFTIYTWVA
jgi:hypothetical protein